MMGRGVLFGVVALIVACGGLYDLKYDVAAREAKLARLDAALAEANDAIHVLRTEWAYLNQPQRLEKLVADRLDLAPVTGAQIVSLDTALDRQRVGGRIESVEMVVTHFTAPGAARNQEGDGDNPDAGESVR